MTALLTENKETLVKLSQTLLEKEVIFENEFKSMLPEPLPA